MTPLSHRCVECGKIFLARAGSKACSGRCRTRAYRKRRELARVEQDRAFALLIQHGDEIRASIGEHREPDRKLLDELGAAMDQVAEHARALLAGKA